MDKLCEQIRNEGIEKEGKQVVITLDTFLKICAGFTAVCVAGGWLIKIIRAAKKPADDIQAKVENNSKKIQKLDEELAYINKALSIVLRVDLAMLGHMRTNNNTGQMATMEQEIQDFLINN